MWFKRKRVRLSKAEVLNSVPLRNPKVETKQSKAGDLVVVVPRRSDWVGKLFAFVFSIPKAKEVVLDEVGREVFELCDGKNNVGKIIGLVAERYKLARREAELSLLTYFRQLARRGIIGFKVEKR